MSSKSILILIAVLLVVLSGIVYTWISHQDALKKRDDAALSALRANQAKKQAAIDARPNVTIEFPKPSEVTR